MNPLLKSYVDKIHSALNTLEEEVVGIQGQLMALEEEKEEMRRENWRNVKEINTLASIRKDYEMIQAENEEFREKHAKLEGRLQRILHHTKALTSEFRP